MKCSAYLAVLAMAFLAASVRAKPAGPQKMVRMQPDGSTVTVIQKGNESFHVLMTADGFLLASDSAGTLRYADSAGRATALTAHDPEMRSAAEWGLLRGQNTASAVRRLKARAPVSAVKAVEQVSTSAVIGSLRRKAAGAAVNRPVRWAGSPPDTGKIRGVVILVQFTDSTFKLSDPKSEYTNFMNQAGYSHYGMAGSVRDYFVAASDSQFTPDFDVYGPVTLSHKAEYYGGNSNGTAGADTGVATMVQEACQKLDGTIDFSKYDSNNDGYVDFVYIFYAGKGESDGGAAGSIWPQAGALDPVAHDGVFLKNFAVSNERSGSATNFALDGVATFIHEFCHILGLPDIYQTSATTVLSTPANWDVMDVGCYNCADGSGAGYTSCTPPYLNAEERYSLGWLDLTELDSVGGTVKVPNLSTNFAYILPSSHDSEFFLLENRQQKSWDAGLPGHGLLVWHVNYDSNAWNSTGVNNSTLRLDVVEADGIASSGDAGDPFPGTSGVTSFTAKTWGGTGLKPSLYNITEKDGLVCFTTASGTVVSCDTAASGTTSIVSAAASRFMVRCSELDVPAGREGRILEFRSLAGRLLQRRPVTAAGGAVTLPAGRGLMVVRLLDGISSTSLKVVLP